MVNRIVILIAVLCWFAASAASALASPAHDHHGHAMKINSPFDQQVKKSGHERSAHCKLRNHKHIFFCPHELGKYSDGTLSIGLDCGGKKNGSPFVYPGSTGHFYTVDSTWFPPVLTPRPFFAAVAFLESSDPDALDPPPRLS